MDKAILVGVDLGIYNIKSSLDELEKLSFELDIKIVDRFIQRLNKPNLKTYIGTGKVFEIKETLKHNEATIVIFDEELSPTQIRNLENHLDAQIIDRSFLILSIFSKRAKTKTAMLEVSLAQDRKSTRLNSSHVRIS